MNQSSLSISDVGKTNPLLQSGGGEAKASSESSESGSFLSTLGAIFQSESESVEEAKVAASESDAEKVNGATVSAESVDGLIDSDGAESAEGVDGEQVSGEGDDILLASDGQDDAEKPQVMVEGESVDAKLAAQPAVDEKAAKVMDEGSELLGRLDESKQALAKESGKSLPQALDSDSPDSLKGEQVAKEQGIEKYLVRSQSVADKESRIDSTKADTSADSDGKPAVSDTQNSVQDIALAQALNTAEQASDKENAQTLATQQMVDGKVNPAMLKEAGQQQNVQAENSSDELVWDSAGITAGASAVGAGMAQNSSASLPSGDEALNIQKALQQLNLQDVPLEELSAEELEYLAQLASVNQMPEPAKASAEMARQVAASNVPNHNQQAALQAMQPAPAAHALADKAQPAPTPLSAAELNAAQLNHAQVSQAQALNPAQLVTANNANAQQKMMASALGAAGGLAAGKLQAGDKGDKVEASLTHQLSGLAAQQGAQQVQMKSDIQQAAQQSPLQLSREAAGERLNEQVQMMMSKNLKNIDIRLDPPELGRMQIRMTMHNDTASVQFTVANQQARDIVEQAMPRLREMLAQQGVQLSDSSVHQQNSGQQQGRYAGGSDTGNANGSQGLSGDGEANLDESINLDVNISSKDDGISYYA